VQSVAELCASAFGQGHAPEPTLSVSALADMFRQLTHRVIRAWLVAHSARLPARDDGLTVAVRVPTKALTKIERDVLEKVSRRTP